MSSRTKLETLSNIVFIVVAVVLMSVWIRNEVARPDPFEEEAKPLLGKTLQIPSVDFRSTPKTVLLVLSSQCGYCRDSLPFYRMLTERRKGKNVRIVAIFPGQLDEEKHFLSDQGIVVDQLVQTPLENLGVLETPTIALTNDRGTILKAWAGRLPDEKQKSVLRKLSL